MANILVIDDDPAMRRLIARILTEAGHQVIEAADGVAGLRKFRAEAPDLIITDIVMPEKEGIETIVEMRRTNSDIGIIAISGAGPGKVELYLNLAGRVGANAFLPKPFRSPELLAEVDRLLNREPPAST